MTEQERYLLQKLNFVVEQVLSGKRKIVADTEDLNGIENEELKTLATNIAALGEQYSDCYGFIFNLASGRLNTEPPQRNAFANPFKQLHSELRHLTWQIQEIANGDYDQRLSFSGDFSESINKMIEALRERHVLAERVQENERLFRSIFNTSPDGIIICDLKHDIINMSNAAMQMLQFNDNDLRERINFRDMLDPADRATGEWFLQSLQHGTAAMCTELRVKPKNASVFWSEHNASVLYDSNGRPKGYIFIFRDISERKVAEQQLLQVAEELEESNKTKDKLFSIIAHDLKNPFNALLGFSDLLLKETASATGPINLDHINKFTKILHDSAAKAFDLLTNLLDWSRIQSNRIVVKPEALDLNEMIDFNIGLTSSNALEKDITITKVCPDKCTVVSDRAIINTILRNLLINAVKYTPPNGHIEVTAKPCSTGGYEISVRDNGIGIKPSNLEKLFRVDRVHSTPGTNNEKGTGLGLVLCKDFVTKIGGDIRVNSEFGEGTTFTFTVKDLQ